jgi:8-oxo-dGTP pyrophosphatase MutT (NUDIX family)
MTAPTNLADRLTKVEREQKWANQRPKDAATLLLIDRTGAVPTVLMGKRHANHKFMPGKYVFPGGRIDAADRKMPICGMISERIFEAMDKMVTRPSEAKTRAIMLTAIRETYEETGLMLGTKDAGTPVCDNEHWADFVKEGVYPELEHLQFIARAITPPKRPKRFDARFFAIDAQHIVYKKEGVITPDSELVDLHWLPFEQAKKQDLPTITLTVLEELETRIKNGFSENLPVPFYKMEHKVFKRYEL